MSLKKLKPVNSSQRGVVIVDKSSLWRGSPYKKLTRKLNSTGGRNSHGHITSRHRGGGHKKRYRTIDFKRDLHDIPATVQRIEYDPNRSAFIALIKYDNGVMSYILAPAKIKEGDQVIAGNDIDINPGNALPLKSIPVGTFIHNVEMYPGRGGQIARSAGNYAQIMGRDYPYVILKLSSGEVRKIKEECFASIGMLSNSDRKNENLGKAGRNRWRGLRPKVRGVAMNPVDHPHGGRTSGGRPSVTPWGVPTKGKRTRTNKRTGKFIIRRRK